MEPWIGPTATLAAFRVAQYAALSLPNVGYSAGTDLGDPLGPFGSVHPRNKKLVGARLAAAALSIQYATPRLYFPPIYASARASGTTVTVSFSNVPTTLVTAEDHCQTEYKVLASACSAFTIVGSDGISYAATPSVGADGKTLILTAAGAPGGVTAANTTFGWCVAPDAEAVTSAAAAAAAIALTLPPSLLPSHRNAWPINLVKSAEGFPLRPWPSTPITA